MFDDTEEYLLGAGDQPVKEATTRSASATRMRGIRPAFGFVATAAAVVASTLVAPASALHIDVSRTRFLSCTPPSGSVKPCKPLLNAPPFPDATAIKGPSGSEVVAWTERNPDARGRAFDLRFSDSAQLTSGISCAHSPTKLAGPLVGGTDGAMAPTTGTIPRGASLGKGHVCFVESLHNAPLDPDGETISTAPAVFKVTA